MFRKSVEATTSTQNGQERTPRGRRLTRAQRLAATGIGITTLVTSLTACGDNTSATPENTSTPPAATATANPGETVAPTEQGFPWETETNDQRYDRYYADATIQTGLSTNDLAAALADRLAKWQNLSLVEPGIQAIATQMTDNGVDPTVVGREDYSEVHIQAFEDALVDTSKSTTNSLGILVKNTSEEAREIFGPNAYPDASDVEPYRTYIDWSDASETQDPVTGRRIITVVFDKWNNSDKNFMDDNPDKGINLIRYTFTVDESEGRAIITDESSEFVN